MGSAERGQEVGLPDVHVVALHQVPPVLSHVVRSSLLQDALHRFVSVCPLELRSVRLRKQETAVLSRALPAGTSIRSWSQQSQAVLLSTMVVVVTAERGPAPSTADM